MVVAVRIVGLVVLAVVLAGCGRAPVGRRVFESRCSACHTLTGHDTPVDGGDLAVGTMSVADVERFARIMPVRPHLTQAEIGAVAAYVVNRHDALQRGLGAREGR
jgi:mono/diheme cytochrome c family protein